MRYHFKTKIENTNNTKCWQGCEITGTLPQCCGIVYTTATLENF